MATQMANEARSRAHSGHKLSAGEHRQSPAEHVRAGGERAPAGGRGHPAAGARSMRRRLLGGGTDGNELLTTITGAVLIVLLAALGLTIVAIGRLLWLHLFLGLLLIGPVALKLASTGYRFLRYYTSDARYRVKGPPPQALRLLAPLVVVLTVGVFATGVVLLIVGPSAREPFLLLHKATFVGWIAVTTIHVLGHLPEIARLFAIRIDYSGYPIVSRAPRPAVRGRRGAAEPEPRQPVAGSAGRWISLASATVFGLVLAIALIPHFGAWTDSIGLFHAHH
jgi:hypothetical protein